MLIESTPETVKILRIFYQDFSVNYSVITSFIHKMSDLCLSTVCAYKENVF